MSKTEITKKDVAYIAGLSRLSLTDKEMQNFVSNLKKIVDYVGKLSELDEEIEKKNIQPTYHAWEGRGVFLRDDVIGEAFDIEDFLAQAPEVMDGNFVVPKVIE